LLAFFGRNDYNLGEFLYLQPVINQFGGSFVWESITARGGNAAWMALDPLWADPNLCEPGETPIACEYRLNNPSVALVSFGTNEGVLFDAFRDGLRDIVQYSINQGVIPVLVTKANWNTGDANNQIIRQVAAEYGVPLWDFARVAEAIPQEMLWDDTGHLLWFPMDYTNSQALFTGHAIRNLTALMALDAVWREAMY
jgi:hypothetical protein